MDERTNIKRLERTVVVLAALAILLGLLAVILLVVTAPAAHAAPLIDDHPTGIHIGGICETLGFVLLSLLAIAWIRYQHR